MEEIIEVTSLREAVPISKALIKKLLEKGEFKPFSFKVRASSRFYITIYRIDVQTINGSFEVVALDRKSKSRKLSDL
jgi:hypothetical protein